MDKFKDYFNFNKSVVTTQQPEEIIQNTIVGPRGPIGPMGPAGPQGPAGEDGWAGPEGPKGDKGDRGPVGPQGPEGPQGPQGPEGPQGEVGWPGDKGEQGVQGPIGPQGLKGDRGPAGPQGPQGETGKSGIDGKPGKDGAQGLVGPAGPQGKAGPKGDTGQPGRDGSVGPKGDKGAKGDSGPQGPKGDKGNPGAEGAQGPKGDPGESNIISANYPLVLEEGELSFDGSKFKDDITKLVKTKLDAQTVAQNFGWLNTGSVGGGAVGIYKDRARVIKSVNDINFVGDNITVTRKGKQVDVAVSGGGGNGTTGPSGILYTYRSTGDTLGAGVLSVAPSGPNNVYVSAQDVFGLDKSNYLDWIDQWPSSSSAPAIGFLYVTSQWTNNTSVYGVGGVSRVDQAVDYYVFNFSTTYSSTISFTDGEPVSIFFIAQGRNGGKGDSGTDGLSVSSTSTSLVTTYPDGIETKTAFLISTLSGGTTLSANLNILGVRTFVQTTAPAGTMFSGDRWYDTDTGILYTRIVQGLTGTWTQQGAAGFTYTANTPAYTPTVGDRWMDSDTGVEYVWIDDGDSTQWIQPTNTAQASTSAISVLQTVSITGATYAATALDYYIGVSFAGQSVITLPAAPETGREMVVKDESGHAGDNINRWITICGASPTKIDNQDTAVLNISNGALQFIYRNGWRII